ncbi:MAG: hypothetical protein JW790_00105 [Dehalococcoidales bacterium]|nr:hypothetical protein [Dehalococcoidales bacterium]
MAVDRPDISNLDEVVASLPSQEKALFQRIYEVATARGEAHVPKEMESWVIERFGSVAAVAGQKVVRVTNLITLEEALFNRLRCLRPVEFREMESLGIRLDETGRGDLFATPEDTTPEDPFGRVSGKHCVTAGNIAKYDGWHGLVIFRDFNPLHFSLEQISDYIDVGWEWARRAHNREPQAKYFFLIWNCLWRAGASIQHGHAQVMLARGRPYARIERLRRAALDYRQRFNADYFSDLFRAHDAVGCALVKEGVRILAHLSPFKDHEVVILSDGLNLSFKERLYEVLTCFRDRLGIFSFNLGLTTPPLAATEESWQGFPVVAWLVDRGDLSSRASDVGGMEIYGASVIGSDPFELARRLRTHLA